MALRIKKQSNDGMRNRSTQTGKTPRNQAIKHLNKQTANKQKQNKQTKLRCSSQIFLTCNEIVYCLKLGHFVIQCYILSLAQVVDLHDTCAYCYE